MAVGLERAMPNMSTSQLAGVINKIVDYLNNGVRFKRGEKFYFNYPDRTSYLILTTDDVFQLYIDDTLKQEWGT